MSFAHPQYLVETDWLEEHLNDAALRILDCNVLLIPEDSEWKVVGLGGKMATFLGVVLPIL